MKLHPHLKTTKKRLENQGYLVSAKEDFVLEVAIDDETLPFCFILVDGETFDGIILSLAADFPFSDVAADIAINLMHVAPVAVGESFYIDDMGDTFWGDEAKKRSSVQRNSLLEDIEPISTLKH
jgi:hypothetical protein